jgi:hypothetical protein
MSTPVTPDFKIKTGCSSYVCPGSSCHTYDQNVNTETQCLYYINFYYKGYCLYMEDYIDIHRAAAEQSNPTGNRPGATQAPRRNLHHSSPSHLCLLSSVTARVMSYPVFMPKPSTHRMHDPGSMVPHIRPKSVHR